MLGLLPANDRSTNAAYSGTADRTCGNYPGKNEELLRSNQGSLYLAIDGCSGEDLWDESEEPTWRNGSWIVSSNGSTVSNERSRS
jgi:hypothetical protein